MHERLWEPETTKPGKARGLIGRRVFLCRPRWRCTTPYVGASSHVLHSVTRWMGPVFNPRKDVDCVSAHEVPSPPRSRESMVCVLSVSMDDECHRQDLQRICTLARFENSISSQVSTSNYLRLPRAFCPRQHVHKKGEAGKNLAYASQHRHLHPTSACPSRAPRLEYFLPPWPSQLSPSRPSCTSLLVACKSPCKGGR